MHFIDPTSAAENGESSIAAATLWKVLLSSYSPLQVDTFPEDSLEALFPFHSQPYVTQSCLRLPSLLYLLLLAFKGFGMPQILWMNKMCAPLDLHFLVIPILHVFHWIAEILIDSTTSGRWHFQQTCPCYVCVPKFITTHHLPVTSNSPCTQLSSLCTSETSCNPLQVLTFHATHFLSVKDWFPHDPFLPFFFFLLL